ncbi:MAG TPA: urease accessory UreF family protein [Acetobacteraceae bacterium]|nr:urease accessory UreF family protein [Acetobacteraceae bacterium]HUN43290.1 urease accessory UreF family protein [Acetobacteraceae bacterium]
MLNLLHAIWQADSAFPSGAFAFSGGLEGLTALGLPISAQTLADLMRNLLLHRWASADRVALARAYRAGGDIDRIAAADDALDSAILVAPLREGSRRNGASMLAAHARIGHPAAQRLQHARVQGAVHGHLPVMQGAIFHALGMTEAAATATAGYATIAALATASVRLGRVGAIEAQSAIAATLPLLAHLAGDPPSEDAPIEGFLPLLDLAAARHAHASVRLFAN